MLNASKEREYLNSDMMDVLSTDPSSPIKRGSKKKKVSTKRNSRTKLQRSVSPGRKQGSSPRHPRGFDTNQTAPQSGTDSPGGGIKQPIKLRGLGRNYDSDDEAENEDVMVGAPLYNLSNLVKKSVETGSISSSGDEDEE